MTAVADFAHVGQTFKLPLLRKCSLGHILSLVLPLPNLLTGCLCLPRSPPGGCGPGLSEGERTGCAGAAESQVFGDVSVG